MPMQLVIFDGVDDYLTRGADLTGNADSKVGIVSFWVELNGGDGGIQQIQVAANEYIQIQRGADDKWNFDLVNSSGTSILKMKSTSTYTVSSGRHHVSASWNLAGTEGWLYIDDAESLAASPTFTNDTIDYTRTNHSIGARDDGGNKVNAGVGDYYFNNETYLDLSVEANRRKFISAGGLPVPLGPTGALPTGSQPIMFFSGPVATWQNNLGSGGGMTENGALSDGGTVPYSSTGRIIRLDGFLVPNAS